MVEAVHDLRYGCVEVLVHEGRVVQIERRERVRLDEASRRQPDNPDGKAVSTAGPTDRSEAPSDTRGESTR